MTIDEKICTASKAQNMVVKYAAIFGHITLAIICVMSNFQTTNAQIDCSVTSCVPADQLPIHGYDMFDETNFDPVLDGLGTPRKFWVHIPDDYDTVDGINMQIPTIFAFHGGVVDDPLTPETPQDMMLDGKWADYFNQDIAFVIPLAEDNPCDTGANPKKIWLGPNWGPGIPVGTPLPADCNPATQRSDSLGDPVTYFDATIPDTFRDVIFIENLRSMLLSRFPKLNPNKVYTTGFSSGGGMSYSLLCYRANLFRGSSIAARTLYGEEQRGDYDADGIVETDPNSLVATCGKSQYDAGRATGISTPTLWGQGIISPISLFNPPIIGRVTKPVALFVGDQDDSHTMDDINQTGNNIRARNNLNNVFFILNPFMNVVNDDAETQHRQFVFVNNASQPFSPFYRYLVQQINDGVGQFRQSAGHAMPGDCPPLPGAPFVKSTCDFRYVDQTITFFQTHADLNLNP